MANCLDSTLTTGNCKAKSLLQIEEFYKIFVPLKFFSLISYSLMEQDSNNSSLIRPSISGNYFLQFLHKNQPTHVCTHLYLVITNNSHYTLLFSGFEITSPISRGFRGFSFTFFFFQFPNMNLQVFRIQFNFFFFFWYPISQIPCHIF